MAGKRLSKTKARRMKAMQKEQARKQKPGKLPRWLPFTEHAVDKIVASQPEGTRQMTAALLAGKRVFANNHYQVHTSWVPSGYGPLIHLAIQRNDGQPVRDWRDLQRIKNELVGVGAEAVELFPAEYRLNDADNTTYLYVLGPRRDAEGQPLTDPQGLWTFEQWPFGYTQRFVTEHPPMYGHQRPWRKEDRPTDLVTLTPEQLQSLHEQHQAKLAQQALEAAQMAHQGVRELQEAADPAEALQARLGPSYAILEGRRGPGVTGNLFSRALELIRYRQALMTKERPDPTDEPELHSLAVEVERILQVFDAAATESATEAATAAGPAGSESTLQGPSPTAEATNDHETGATEAATAKAPSVGRTETASTLQDPSPTAEATNNAATAATPVATLAETAATYATNAATLQGCRSAQEATPNAQEATTGVATDATLQEEHPDAERADALGEGRPGGGPGDQQGPGAAKGPAGGADGGDADRAEGGGPDRPGEGEGPEH